jgi:DNA-binding IclR family transcriptional regulator
VNGGEIGRKTENMHRRFCLGFDFDRKDFKDKFRSVKRFAKHFRETTGLYIHFAVDSGNGYHFYVAIEETTDIKRVVDITKRFSVLSGADIGVAHAAQMLRFPGTMNCKNPISRKRVNLLFGYRNNENFFRYSFDMLEYMLKIREKASGIQVVKKTKPTAVKMIKTSKGFKCVRNMLEKGVPKGERNKCLGRIVSYLRDVEKWSDTQALEAVKKWNEKCSSAFGVKQKSDNEISREFYVFWKRNYNMLGCVADENGMKGILVKYCEQRFCVKKHSDDYEKDGFDAFILDSRYATNKCLLKLKGYAYVIIKILTESEQELRASELVEITGFGKKIVERALGSLMELDLIKNCGKTVAMYKSKNFAPPKDNKRIALPVKLFDMLMDGKIKEQELVTYIAIRRNAYMGKKCTLRELAKVLGIDYMTVHSTIKKRMVPHGLLEIEKRRTGQFIKSSDGIHELAYNFYRFPLELGSYENAELIEDEGA